ncbi:hypothetical protein SISSUDRAFT_1051434 [Sistotremastrum suecicum HHB10207 ss-3]|uniref:F-box domain-containing protein n=1 Tax=Sistotremastrum suecicum HHB10207 ss-3 TaxID=1314776 RepID=A0A166AKC0_9AGAM|nr:hypothetical protein SISSUDRAFT_1051434 [Sistotremastrum suecicum HHB10207 ss-3]
MDLLSHKELYHCSRVSKAVSSAALDALYRSGVGMLDWFRLLAPLDKLKCDCHNRQNFVYTPGPLDWDRFYSYAVRARSINAVESMFTGLCPQACQTLMPSGQPGHVLFPSLRSVFWSAWTPQGIRFMQILLHENLNQLILHAPLDELGRYFRTATNLSPNLRRFRLVQPDYEIPPSVLEEFETAIQSWNMLERLTVPSTFLSSRVMELLAPKLTLTDVWATPFRNCVNLDEANASHDMYGPSVSVRTGPYLSLRNLSLDIDHFLLPAAPQILAAPSLQQLHIQISGTTDSEDLDHCISLVVRHCPSLVALSITCSARGLGGEDSSDADSPITSRAVEKILQIPALQYLEIDDSRIPKLHDDDLKALAPRCAGLRVLRLCPSSFNQIHMRGDRSFVPPPTLKSLRAFIEHCPRLETLGYFIDASVVPPPLPRGQDNLLSCHFGLEVGMNSPINNTAAVVAFLMEIMALDSTFSIEPTHCYSDVIGGGPVRKGEVNARWKEVMRMLCEFRRIREKLDYLTKMSCEGRSTAPQST